MNLKDREVKGYIDIIEGLFYYNFGFDFDLIRLGLLTLAEGY